MTAQTDPYVRVYYRIVDDSRFETVYDDDRLLATWLRLLLTADATYPAPAPIPANVNRKAFDHLLQVGIVERATGHRYRIHGLTSEREKRIEAARKAANARHGKDMPPDDAPPGAPAVRPHSGGNPPASNGAVRAPMRFRAETAETSRDESANARTPEADPYLDLLALFEELTQVPHVLPRGNRNTPRLLRWVEKDGWAKVEREARSAAADLGGMPELNQLCNTLDDYLHPSMQGRRESPKEREERERQERVAALNAKYAGSQA